MLFDDDLGSLSIRNTIKQLLDRSGQRATSGIGRHCRDKEHLGKEKGVERVVEARVVTWPMPGKVGNGSRLSKDRRLYFVEVQEGEFQGVTGAEL